MSREEKFSPQKAQWAFMHAVFPGRLFPAGDPLVRGNMAMLRAAECEGLVRDTGWVANGLWNYFASFYAHAWLWLGDGRKAAQTLYAFANHASPLLCWIEEQMPVGEGRRGLRRHAAQLGQCRIHPPGAAPSRLGTRRRAAPVRGPAPRVAPAGQVGPHPQRFDGVRADFAGAVRGRRRIESDLTLDPPHRDPPRRILLHLDGWAGKGGTTELPLEKAERDIPLRGLGGTP